MGKRSTSERGARAELRVAILPGLSPYAPLWETQRALAVQRWRGEISDTLILLEHVPVVTLGKSALRQHLLLSEAELKKRGVSVVPVDRGGDVTYHGPGQLVGYWIFDLKQHGEDVHHFLRAIEEVLIRTLADFGIAGERSAGATGVWVGNEKVAAMGLHLSHWVSTHGFALNVSTDLAPFDWIVPCGLRGRGVTSMERLLGAPPEFSLVASRVVQHAGEIFELRPRYLSARECAIMLSSAPRAALAFRAEGVTECLTLRESPSE